MKKHLIVTISLIALCSLVAMALLAFGQSRRPAATSEVHASYVTDFSDSRRLVGFADNVFVGTVLARNGTHSPSGMPETLFTVQVTRNIKGQLPEEIVVNQPGGQWEDVSTEDEGLLLIDNDPLLVVGQAYLFATRASNSGAWHTVVPNYGDLPIADEMMRQKIVREFENAVGDAIPFEAGKD